MLGINLNISMADMLSPLGGLLSQYVTRTNNNQHLRLMEICERLLFLCVSLFVFYKVEKINLVLQEIDHYNAKIFHEEEMQISLSASAPE